MKSSFINYWETLENFLCHFALDDQKLNENTKKIPFDLTNHESGLSLYIIKLSKSSLKG